MELLRQDGGLEQLKEWPPELALKFEQMPMEHHHIFSLDKNQIGCTDTAEHIIELMDDKLFKERFRQIAPPCWKRSGRIYKTCWTEGQSSHRNHLGVTP